MNDNHWCLAGADFMNGIKRFYMIAHDIPITNVSIFDTSIPSDELYKFMGSDTMKKYFDGCITMVDFLNKKREERIKLVEENCQNEQREFEDEKTRISSLTSDQRYEELKALTISQLIILQRNYRVPINAKANKEERILKILQREQKLFKMK